MKNFCVCVNEEQREKLEREAKEQKRPISNLLRLIIDEYFEQKEKEQKK